MRFSLRALFDFFLSIQLFLIELMLVEVVHVDPIQYLVKHDNLINSNHDLI